MKVSVAITVTAVGLGLSVGPVGGGERRSKQVRNDVRNSRNAESMRGGRVETRGPDSRKRDDQPAVDKFANLAMFGGQSAMPKPRSADGGERGWVRKKKCEADGREIRKEEKEKGKESSGDEGNDDSETRRMRMKR
jgi:hypothetical protein